MAAYFEKSTGYTPQALQALGERGEAMSAYYVGSGSGGAAVSRRDPVAHARS